MSAPFADQDPQSGPGGGGPQPRRIRPGQVAGGLLVVLALVFIFENTATVHVRLIFPQVHMPLFFALLIAAVLGGLATLLLQYRRRRRP